MEKNGSSLWFWLGTTLLAIFVFTFVGTTTDFIISGTPITEWPIEGMIAILGPLLIFGIYCVRRGAGDQYSIKADALPLIVFALILGLVYIIPPEIWSVIFVLGIIFLSIYLLHRRALRKKGVANISRRERNRRVTELQCHYDEVFDLCVLALNTLQGKPRILTEDRTMGRIVAKTCATLYSWGETVTINIRRISSSTTQVEISSKSASLQILDYGKNFENVEKIVSFLRKKCKSEGIG